MEMVMRSKVRFWRLMYLFFLMTQIRVEDSNEVLNIT